MQPSSTLWIFDLYWRLYFCWFSVVLLQSPRCRCCCTAWSSSLPTSRPAPAGADWRSDPVWWVSLCCGRHRNSWQRHILFHSRLVFFFCFFLPPAWLWRPTKLLPGLHHPEPDKTFDFKKPQNKSVWPNHFIFFFFSNISNKPCWQETKTLPRRRPTIPLGPAVFLSESSPPSSGTGTPSRCTEWPWLSIRITCCCVQTALPHFSLDGCLQKQQPVRDLHNKESSCLSCTDASGRV